MSVKTDNVDMIFDMIKVGIIIMISYILIKSLLQIPNEIAIIFIPIFFIVINICLIIAVLFVYWNILKLREVNVVTMNNNKNITTFK